MKPKPREFWIVVDHQGYVKDTCYLPPNPAEWYHFEIIHVREVPKRGGKGKP